MSAYRLAGTSELIYTMNHTESSRVGDFWDLPLCFLRQPASGSPKSLGIALKPNTKRRLFFP